MSCRDPWPRDIIAVAFVASDLFHSLAEEFFRGLSSAAASSLYLRELNLFNLLTTIYGLVLELTEQ